jgi:3-phenylpropionate/trans-cinnamate dioxygenase ferredoxin reductase component
MGMQPERIVIVGAGPAGLSTARSYRDCGGSAEVTLVGAETLPPYERPPLTKEYLRGETADEDLPLEQQEWFTANAVRLRLGASVQKIEPAGRSVTLADGEQLAADTIVLATGSEPVRPELPGAEDPGVLTIRTLPDSKRIIARTDAGEPVVVIGTGFIGCELAASLAMRGNRVTLIGQEQLPQVRRLGLEGATPIAGWLAELGVELIADASVSAIHEGETVELQDGTQVSGSCVVLAAGVRPRGRLAEAAGLQMRDGAVVVDAGMRSSSAPHGVLAVGDLACAYNAVAQRHLRVEHWGDALGHGEIAGRTLAGADASWSEVPGFWSTIGRHTLKYAAWGDGYEQAHLVNHPDGAFTVWYGSAGATVGVLTHERDEDYKLGSKLISEGAPLP